MTVAPTLVLGIGNPSRGDDALGPTLIARAEVRFADALARGSLELQTDFQLQVEHALDLAGRARVIFVDASVSAAPPFTFTRVTAQRGASISSHAVSPGAVLAALQGPLRGRPLRWRGQPVRRLLSIPPPSPLGNLGHPPLSFLRLSPPLGCLHTRRLSFLRLWPRGRQQGGLRGGRGV